MARMQALPPIFILALCTEKPLTKMDTLYGVFPYIVPTILLLLWVASRTSAED
jgi:hypothetical protein